MGQQKDLLSARQERARTMSQLEMLLESMKITVSALRQLRPEVSRGSLKEGWDELEQMHENLGHLIRQNRKEDDRESQIRLFD